MPDFNLNKLSHGEAYWLWRRRHGKTQAQMGEFLGVCEKLYWQIENDQVRRGVVARYPTPKPPELCALARRRDGRTLRELAAAMGLGSHVTFLACEREADPRLVKAWKGLGYRF